MTAPVEQDVRMSGQCVTEQIVAATNPGSADVKFLHDRCALEGCTCRGHREPA